MEFDIYFILNVLLGLAVTVAAFTIAPLVFLWTRKTKFDMHHARQIALINSVLVGIGLSAVAFFVFYKGVALNAAEATANSLGAMLLSVAPFLFYAINYSILTDKSSCNPETRLLRNTRLTLIVSLAVTNALFSFVLAPMKSYMVADKTFGFDYLPDIIDASITLVQILGVIAGFAVTIYSIYRFSFKKALPAMAIYVIMTVYKFGSNLVAGWFLFDGVPHSSDLGFHIIVVAANALLQLIPYFITLLLIKNVMARAWPIFTLQKKNYEKSTGEKFEKRDFVFPFKGWHNKKNPLQHSSFIASMVLIGFAVLVNLIPDIIIDGLPVDAMDAMWVIANYTFQIGMNLAAYLLINVFMINLDTHELKLKAEYDE